MSRRRIGVLALQGDFHAHAGALERAGAEPVEIRSAGQLASIDGLVIPGGESSTMLTLLNATELTEPLREFGKRKPVFGTCAGAILLASSVTNPVQESLNLVDMDVERNAYGRQLDSRIVQLEAKDARLESPFEAVFIRAPIIRRVGENARVLAEYAGTPVLVEHGPHLVATFHPELSAGEGIHELFLRKIESSEPA